jgi:NADH:ubiquinone oxidoreductase subunit F (NADH-binding)
MINQVLDAVPCADLAAYRASGGGLAVATASELGGDATIRLLEDAGLRGRGGAGFPTGIKWRTVADARGSTATPVVVNAAEGEPGTFKDRTLLRRNPYKVLEGALVAAVALGSDEVIVATKAAFAYEIRRLRQAIDELTQDPLVPGITVRIALGPEAYLFGEETALLEVVEGRQPFPRIAPPYRRGLDPNEAEPNRNASRLHLAVEGGSDEPPALVDNVETFANVPGIMANGSDWYRQMGTDRSPGTVLCTVTGHTDFHGVGEFPMGTPLAEVLAQLGGGPLPGHRWIAAISGVANSVLAAEQFDTPVSYEAMTAAGSGLGAAGFLVFDDRVDPLSIAHGISRFLAVESCGQCEPCKTDGLTIARILDGSEHTPISPQDVEVLRRRLDTVVVGARCFLASQQQQTVTSLLALLPDDRAARLSPAASPGDPVVIAPLVDIVAGRAVIDAEHARKQPDWSYGPEDSGATPAARYANTPVSVHPRHTDLATGTNAPSTGAVDAEPLDQLRVAHRGLHQTMAQLEHDTDPSASRDHLVELLRQLQDHEDVTTRIVYPAIERAVPGDGDDAAWVSEHSTHLAVRQIERLRGSSTPPSQEDLVALHSAIDEHCAHGEHVVIPLLRSHLDDADVERLAQAIADASITSSRARRSAPA